MRARLLERRSGDGGDNTRDFDVAQIRDALFIDPVMGHAGAMMNHIMALLWVNKFYKAEDLDAISNQFDQKDVQGIFSNALDFNAKFTN